MKKVAQASQPASLLDELARLLRESPADVLTAVASAWSGQGRPWACDRFTPQIRNELDFTEHHAGHDDRGVSRAARARGADLTAPSAEALLDYVQHFDGALLYDRLAGDVLFEEMPDPWPGGGASPHRGSA